MLGTSGECGKTMYKCFCLALPVFLLAVPQISLSAQEDEIQCVISFLGVSSAEEVTELELESLSWFLSHPLNINLASRSRLSVSGLFSGYQVESLLDYRKNNGIIASFVELSLVDGFDGDFVHRLAPFITLGNVSGTGRNVQQWKPVRNDLAVRTACLLKDRTAEATVSGGVKYRIEAGDRMTSALGASFSGKELSAYNLSMAYGFRIFPGKLVTGDFNARFGQGLALWNGAMMTGLNGVASFYKRPSGISVPWSYTGNSSFSGVAGEFAMGRFGLSLFLNCPGLKHAVRKADKLQLMPGINLTYYGRREQLGITHYMSFAQFFQRQDFRIPDMKTSVDFRACYGGVDIFSELAFDYVNLAPAALMGVAFPAGEQLKLAVHLRYYTKKYSAAYSGAVRSSGKASNEYAMSLGGDFSCGDYIKTNSSAVYGASIRKHSGSFCVDAAYFPETASKTVYICGFRHSLQAKILMTYNLQCNSVWKIAFRFTERLRSVQNEPLRTDFRTDLVYSHYSWFATLRLNLLHCRDIGFLTYAEAGYRYEKLSVYLRQGYFRVMNWSDRIYAYERDAPGSFLVPAYYGHGLSTSAFLSWHIAAWLKIYARASWTGFPFARQTPARTGKADFRLSLAFKF